MPGQEERFRVDRTDAESADLCMNLSGFEENPLKESIIFQGAHETFP
jgi:hypothetical protein